MSIVVCASVRCFCRCVVFVFFFNDTETPEIYPDGHTLSLHDALPIYKAELRLRAQAIEHGLQLVRGTVEIERIGGAHVEMDLAIQVGLQLRPVLLQADRKSTRLNSSH